MMKEPCIHFCIDDYLGTFQDELWANRETVEQEWAHIIGGFHAAAAAMARAGNLVIVDDVLEDNPPWIENLLELFDGLEVVFIGVHCPLEELERRERKRMDRKRGMARLQFEQVHAQAIYDIEVDTSILSPEECASVIVEHLGGEHHPTESNLLRQSYTRRRK